MAVPCGAPSPTKPKSKPTWRCEVCDYETNVARNLRIHMTSEKHMHNMMLLQQNVTQMQHGRLGLGAMPSPSEAELYQYYLTQNMSLPPGLKMDPAGAEAQFLMGSFHLDPNMAALAPALGGEIPMDMRLGGGQLVSEELMTLGESLSQTSDPSLKLFQCAVCNRFTTDNLDVLGMHMGAERSLPEEEWRAVVGDSHQCKLCRYTTQLKANFQLHCKTDKHVQKYQLVAHIKEGGKGNEWRLKCVAIGNPVHLKCNACDYYTNSLEKLRMHTVNSRHEASLKVYKHLQHHENAVEGDACYYHCVLCNYSTKAKLNLIQHVRSMKHQRSESLRKLQRLQKGLPEEEDDLSTIFTIRKCPSSDTGELSEDVEAASETTTDQEDQTKDRESGGEKELTKGTGLSGDGQTTSASGRKPTLCICQKRFGLDGSSVFNDQAEEVRMYQCPYCKFTNTDLNRLRMHVMTQHSVQPMFRCPLCQDMLNNKIHLQFHLTHLHSVAPDCVDKLIATVTATEVLPASMFLPVPGPDRESQSTPQATANSNPEETKKQTDVSDAEPEKGVSLPTEIAEARKSPLEDQQSGRDDATGFLCWKKGCNQVFKSSNSLQMHFNEVHNKRPQLPVSDRHVYKYRCNQCSLAFKTVEKLQLHSQYHVIRAATMCCLCQRSFRTLQALKKHLETSHLELSEADIQQLYGGLLMNGDIMVMGDPSLGEEHGSLGEDDKEGEESDPEEKQSPTGSDSGSLQEDSGSEPKRALPFRKGPNFTMEKFLDPSRPFKCTVCKESFTQKNILLVHYNSVSHLHKVKRALQESTTGQPEPTSSPDNKPFKCSTCNVAYSQSSTLEIHMRSVLHQTKARAAKLEAAGGSTSSGSATGLSSGGSCINTSTPSPSPATNSTTNSSNHSSSGSQTAQNILGGNHMNQPHSIESLGNSSVSCHSSPSENHEVKKKKFADMLSARGQQQQLQQQQQLAQAQAQAQAQLQQELQQQAALIQSQLFNPALLQHFPMTTDALLPLQQQQLLFPFYIPGAEFQLNPEININSSALGLAGSSTSSLLEDLKNSAQQLSSVESGLASDLAQLYQQQLTPAMLQQQQNKRPRTRITDDQLRVLRQYFDINNSPNEDQIKEMADKSGLPQKVIKHWFRNTLFKERQRNKDSPYNFNNPPITTLEDTKIDSKPPSPEPLKQECYGSKRSSRTRFTDYQLRVLQDFFDANAYPKDDEFEQLSNLLSLPTRVIVVWFQNARQKARKNYENQGDGGKDGERRELSNDRYIRTTNLNYQCKKCSLVFQRIFDLIKHQKKLCYKDEDEDGQYDSQNEDSMDLSHEYYTPSGSSCHTPMPSSSSLCPLPPSTSAFSSHLTSTEKDEASPANTSNSYDEKPKQLLELSVDSRETQTPIKQEIVHQPQSETQHHTPQREEKTQTIPKAIKHSSSSFSQQQQQCGPSASQTSQAPSQSSHMSLNPHLTSASQQQLAQQMIPYQCEQCKLGFPSFEHWQEHQQLHFLSVQNQFIHPQFLDRPMDMSFMLFDPSNPLLASQLLSGAMPQIPSSSATSPSTPTSTMNSLKRKLEEKAGTSPGENDSTNSGEEPQRDKRLRTTITPEQLEILYQKYLLDSNPTRKMLDHIAHEVGLKKRVVQVWFQNTRARERKGQFRAVGPAQAHRRCPFCRALFKAKTALEAHIRSRHWHEAKRAGYNLTLTGMLHEQEGMQMKMDPLDISSYSQLAPTNNDGQSSSLSPVSKNMDLSPRALLSPSSIKVEGIEDFESPTMSSVNLSFDQNKLDNDDCSSVNTAITDTTTGDEANADMDSADAKHGQNSGDYLSKSGGTAPSLENDDQMSSGLVSPATSYYAKDYENENIIDYSETSSLADPCSPSPGASGSRSIDSGDRPGQKRFRTQMTNLQLKVLKSCFNDYRTPTMLECEVLGNDIGLPKRVVQVWFQNARAKEKKAKLSMAKHFGINQTSYEGPKTECTLCGVKYSARLSVRDHIFSQQHISKVKDTIGSQLDKEKEYFDPATVRQLMAQQEMDRIKKANEVLGLAQQQAMQQQGMFDNPAMQALNLQSAYPNLQGIPPVLLPGVGSPSLPSFNSSNSALTSPKPPNLLNMPGASVPSPSLPTSGLPNKPPSSSTLASSSPAQTSTSVSHSSPTTSISTSSTAQSGSRPEPPKERDAERLREKEKLKEKADKPTTPSSTGSTPAPSTSAASAKKEKPDTAVPATSMPTPGMEYVVDPAQLQALQAALASDPTALLTSQFLPYFMPGFSPYYAPQIPGALQGGYLQPMYGMESLFPYNPTLSQALMGLSPGSLLQHYQQYQQSLQEALQQQQRQLQQIQQPKASQTPVPPQPSGDRKESAKDPVKTEEKKGKPNSEPSSSSSHNKLPSEQNEMDGKAVDPHLDQYIVPKVQYKLACRKCQAVFTKEEAAVTHLKSICFFGQSVANLQEMLLRVPGGVGAGAGSLYDCLACDTTLNGEKALSQHLESALHKHRTIKRSARNAKEHATSLLPHSSACFPNPNTASTSQSATHPISSPPPPPTTSATMPSSAVSSSLCSSSTTPLNTTAAGKPWSQAPFSRALAGKPNATPSSTSSSFPPVSSPSTSKVAMLRLFVQGSFVSKQKDILFQRPEAESRVAGLGKVSSPYKELEVQCLASMSILGGDTL
ncbi:zinc finger homeobox protein 3 [Diretmus argenteus]